MPENINIINESGNKVPDENQSKRADNPETRPLFDAMRKIKPDEIKTALDNVGVNPEVGICIAPLSTPSIEVAGQEYFFYAARVLAEKASGAQPYVTPHVHSKGGEPYFFLTGKGEINFGSVVNDTVVWDPAVTVNPEDEFLIQENKVHSFRNLGDVPTDFIFACPKAHLEDKATGGDRLVVTNLPGGVPSHYSPK